MRVWIFGSFIKWCVEKIFGGSLNKIQTINREFRTMLKTESFLAFFLWVLLTLLLSAGGLLFFGAIFKIYIVVLLIPVASLCYLVYNIFYVAWQSFKKDRQHLFENIKQL